MMTIRYGVYTVYKSIEMSVTEYYGHGLSQDVEQNHRIISYPSKYGELEDFLFDKISEKYKKDILIKDLSNAFETSSSSAFISGVSTALRALE